MTKRKLHPDGPEVSDIVYGCWRLGEDPAGTSLAVITAKMQACLQNGINTFDHADIYGGYSNEALFGEAFANSGIKREDLVLISKCGIKLVNPARPEHRVKHYDTGRWHLINSVEASLKNLRTDYLDLLLLHRPDPLMDAAATAEALEELIGAGKIRHVGVSNFPVEQQRLLASKLGVPIVSNQLEFSLLYTEPLTNGIIDYQKQVNSIPMAWSPLAGGRLLSAEDARAANIRTVLEKLAVQYQTSIETLALAWVLKAGVLPVIGTNNLTRIKQSAAAIDIALDLQDWYLLYEASLGHPVA
ncbi:MAG: aldo/keto reductase [Chitinophagales bacterium]|nr:aldo/keto reductase [Chitinophagales bacterium]